MSVGGKMSKTKRTKDMPKGHFRLAVSMGDSFYNTACVCEKDSPSEWLGNCLFPYVVNMSFACEVYMKAIMIHFSKTNEFSTGHELQKLFAKLNHEAQKSVREWYEQEPRVYCEKLDSFLEEHNDIFMDFRYPFQDKDKDKDKEGLSVHVTGLGTFARSLNRYCHDLMGEVENEQA